MTFDEWWDKNARKYGWGGSDDGSIQAEAAWDYLQAELKWLQREHVRVCSSESELKKRVEELEDKERENFNAEVDAKKRHDILAGQGRRLYELNKRNMELGKERAEHIRLLNNWAAWYEQGGGLGCLPRETLEALRKSEALNSEEG